MKLKRIPFIFFLLFCFSACIAQDLNYAHYILNRLTSKDFAGRGYVQDGIHKAADFITHQFDSLHLQKFAGSYSQNFSYDVNTFPGKAEINIDGQKLIPGKDFILSPLSGSGKGTCKVYTLKDAPKGDEDVTKFFKTNFRNKVLFIDIKEPDKEAKDFISSLKREEFPGAKKPAAIMFCEEKKLTMSVSTKSLSYPAFTVLQSALPSKIKTVSFDIESKFISNYTASNIIAFIKGSEQPDSFLVISAHYDHLGMIGTEVYFPGANDNASGVSLMLNLAEYFSKHQPRHSIAFIAFAGEEIGLLGSEHYTEHPLFPLSQIKFLINLDLLGTGEEGMMVVNATEFPDKFHLLDSINTEKKYLSKLSQRGKAKNSDHYWFTEKGVPAFFFYTMGGPQAYHDINDKAETLPLTEFNDVFKLIVDFNEALNN